VLFLFFIIIIIIIIFINGLCGDINEG